MKKIILLLLVLLGFTSCKKNNTAPSNSSTTTPPPSGSTWTTITSPLGSSSTQTINSACAVGSSIFVGTSKGVYVSSDNGNTWKATSIAGSGNIASDSAECEVIDNNSILYLTTAQEYGTWSPAPATGMFRSSDNGNTWDTAWNSVAPISYGNYIGQTPYFAYTPYSVYFNGSTIIFAAGNYVFKSLSGGLSWSTSASVEPATSTNANVGGNIVTDGTNFFIYDRDQISNAGVYKSTDNCATFSLLVNDTLSKYSLTNMVAMGSKIYIADRQNYAGIYVTANGGNTFTPVNNGLKDILFGIGNYNIYGFITDGTNLFAGTTNAVFTSSNGGVSWTQLGANIPNSSSVNQISITTLLEANGYIFAMTSTGSIYRIKS
jgi:photosystem II stability/assembly factor-like uncharacterized protein